MLNNNNKKKQNEKKIKLMTAEFGDVINNCFDRPLTVKTSYSDRKHRNTAASVTRIQICVYICKWCYIIIIITITKLPVVCWPY